MTTPNHILTDLLIKAHKDAMDAIFRTAELLPAHERICFTISVVGYLQAEVISKLYKLGQKDLADSAIQQNTAVLSGIQKGVNCGN
jgi:hypothetical protein